jgi:hypothetical protein
MAEEGQKQAIAAQPSEGPGRIQATCRLAINRPMSKGFLRDVVAAKFRN